MFFYAYASEINENMTTSGIWKFFLYSQDTKLVKNEMWKENKKLQEDKKDVQWAEKKVCEVIKNDLSAFDILWVQKQKREWYHILDFKVVVR